MKYAEHFIVDIVYHPIFGAQIVLIPVVPKKG